MKPFLTYITEDSKQIIDANNNKIKARMVANGLAANVSELPENIHDSFSRSLGEIPEHHKSWIAKRYADGGIKHVEDIAKVSALLKRHDELLAQKLVSPVALRNLKTDADLFGLIQNRDPNNIAPVKNVNVSSDKVKPHEYTLTGENEEWTEITPHTENAACEFGRGTNWCTASTSNSEFNRYNKNGPMHILIPKNPRHKGERYQIHPHSDQMMDETDTPVDFSEIEGYQRPVPHKGKISAFKLTKETHIGAESDDSAIALAALASPHADARTTHRAVRTARQSQPIVALTALRSPHADARTTHGAVRHNNPEVALAALASPHADATTTHGAVRNDNPEVALAGLASPHADSITNHFAAKHLDSRVAMAALKHPLADADTVTHAATHKNPDVVMAALKHSLADEHTTRIAVEHPDSGVAMAGLKHALADEQTTYHAARHSDPAVAMAAVAHPLADTRTIRVAAWHSNPEVAIAALAHRSADATTTHLAAQHKDPRVIMAALKHAKADKSTTFWAAKHSDPAVAMAALASPHANAVTTHAAIGLIDRDVSNIEMLNDGMRKLALAAVNHPKADSETISQGAQYRDPQVALAALSHPLVDSETISRAQRHKHPEVRKMADSMSKKLKILPESYSAGKIKPFIRFLKEEDLTLEYHDTLNPKIWDGDKLKPEVQAKLLQIAKKWATFAKIPDFAVTDIILVGGNANYNWTKFSDLDLHVVVNREDLADCPDLLDDYLQNKKQLWALVHDITIYGHDVELYAQDRETPYPKKQGVYSIKNKKWIAQPKHENVDFRGPVLLAKVKQYTERIDTLISTNAEDESFSKLKEKFKNMRTSGLKKIGEFSLENLIFKELRNRGVIDRMTKYLQSRLDQKLSLNENYPFQIQVHKKDGNELVEVKQLNSETKYKAMDLGLRAIQLAKRKYPDFREHHFSVRFPHDSDWIAPTT